MKSLVFLSIGTALAVSCGVYACSNNEGLAPSLNTPGAGGTTATNTGVGSTPSIGSTTSTSNATGGKTGVINTGTGMPDDPDAACGSGDQPAELTPVYMVFMYDKSGSMGDDPNGQWQNDATRWTPMKLGMTDFFTNSGTIGIQASLEFFPAPGDKTTTCHADYKTPTVPMTPLETPQALISALNTTKPGGGTPTLPAVMGGLAYAKQLMTNKPGSKAVLVLVTDGEPAIYNSATGQVETDCAPTTSPDLTNTIGTIVDVVSAAYRNTTASVLTYVIGIGEAQGDMAAIATAGGTEYIAIDVTQGADATRKTLTEKLKKIRTTQFVCSMPIPESSDFRKDMVNVSFKHTNGTIDRLGKSAGCTAAGWYFDNETTPTKIELCPAACTAIQSDLTGKLQVLLGCPTVIL